MIAYCDEHKSRQHRIIVQSVRICRQTQLICFHPNKIKSNQIKQKQNTISADFISVNSKKLVVVFCTEFLHCVDIRMGHKLIINFRAFHPVNACALNCTVNVHSNQ